MTFSSDYTKKEVFREVAGYLKTKNLNVIKSDDTRPWGGFYVIDEKQADQFIKLFFPHLESGDFSGFSKLSPKILMVEPGMRLSWQYHHRRAEIWKVIGGSAGVVVSDTDELQPLVKLDMNEIIELNQGQRHRLVGLENEWGIIAEIWKHTDKNNPSDEDDIVRVEDDFGR
jgi:mannose-6-phosphate isomerase-like protein (cupin superfamily)